MKAKEMDVLLGMQSKPDKDKMIDFVMAVIEEGQTTREEIEDMDIMAFTELVYAINEAYDLIDKKKVAEALQNTTQST